MSKAKSVISDTKFWLSRPRLRLAFFQSQFWDWVQDFNFLSLSFETETETGSFWVSMLRPSPRLYFSESQYPYRVRDWNYQSLNLETESETIEMVETESLAILCFNYNAKYYYETKNGRMAALVRASPKLTEYRQKNNIVFWGCLHLLGHHHIWGHHHF